MQLSARYALLGILPAVAMTFVIATDVSYAQGADDETIEEIVTTGTRRAGQSPTETLSPIDVLGGESIANQSTYDMTDGLTKIAPSINTQRFPVADGTAFIRPVSLRNLSPDQTLVLVNGLRRHRSPLVNLQFAPLGTVNQGAQAVDFAMIPTASIQRIEVLRDGASAQYGSDAIAGVINIILKDAPDGISLSAQTGEYFESDGTRTTISANLGLPLADAGYVNLTGEHSTSDKTSRGGPWFSCPAVIAEVGTGVVPLDEQCIRWGDPDVEATRFVINAGYDISDSLQIYGHATFSQNEVISDFFYRAPVLPASAGVGGHESLIVDTDGDFLPDPVPQAQIDDLLANGIDPSLYLTADGGSPSGWVFLNPIASQFPGGFNPDFGADLTDFAVAFGLQGETGGGMSWNVRAGSASSEAEYVLQSSINPSLGSTSPTSFTPGKLTQEELILNANFVKPIDVQSFASPLNVAFGFEYREETYEIEAGDPASIEIGPVTNFGVWSNGFQGFPTESAGSFDSPSYAAYLDLEADLTDRFTFGAAVRFEDYDEFGDTTDGKISGRYQFNDQFAIRATASTGFRAPTPGQVNTLNTTTSADAQGVLTPSTTFPVNSVEAVTLGAIPLVPEESTSLTAGLVWQPGDRTSITLDVYRIEVDDRLALLGPLTMTQQDVDDLIAAGVPNAQLLLGSLYAYFANAFDSEVTGFDVVLTHVFDVGGGDLTLDLRHNQNEQEVSNVAANTITPDRVFDLENQTPQSRSTLTLDYQSGGMFGGYVRLNSYGSWDTTEGLFSGGTADNTFSYGSEFLVDIEAYAVFADRFRVTVGAENVFDVQPDDELGGTLGAIGIRKALTSPFGFNGGFWYLRLTADF